MHIPPLPVLKRAAKQLVQQAKVEDTLNKLTPRIVRQQLEEQFSLESGSLDKYKTELKRCIEAAVDEDESEPGKSSDDDESKKALASKSPKKRESDELKDNKQTKKAKTTHTRPSSTKADPPPSRGKKKAGNTKYKSVDVIATSDIEPDGDALVEPIAESSKGPRSSSPDKSPKMPKVKQNKGKSSSVSEMPPPSKKASSQPQSNPEISHDEEKSESDVSILIDEPPKRKSSKEEKGSKSNQSAKSKERKKTGKELSKDEETIKRLKGFVLACGVRKVWAKEFKDLDKPSQQIERLKEILADLGMTGRYSYEQAKAIKAKRELQQELEDVTAFERAVVGDPSHTSKLKKQEGDSEKDEDEAEIPTKRKTTARASILAFLADQSDSDE